MCRWVLLEHKIYDENLVDTHFDFLIENGSDCLTWKFIEIPTELKGYIEIIKQPNHRLVWLSRKEYELSNNRGSVKRIDKGILKENFNNLDSREFSLVLKGKYLNGILNVKGNFCRLKPIKQ